MSTLKKWGLVPIRRELDAIDVRFSIVSLYIAPVLECNRSLKNVHDALHGKHLSTNIVPFTLAR